MMRVSKVRRRQRENDDPCRRFRQVLAGENRPHSPRRR